MSIDFTKPVQTVEGRPVKIIFTDGRGDYPVIGYIGDETILRTWNYSGEYEDGLFRMSYDLQNVPEEREMWVNVYPEISGFVHKTRESADKRAVGNRIACVHVKYKVGEGL